MWLNRGKCKVFYLCRRVNGVPRQFRVGTGPLAEKMAAGLEARKQARKSSAEACAAWKAKASAADSPLDELCAGLEQVTTATLLAVGPLRGRTPCGAQALRRRVTARRRHRSGGDSAGLLSELAKLEAEYRGVVALRVTLTITCGPEVGRPFTFTGLGTFLIGRSSRARLQLPSGEAGDLHVSHTHCLVEFGPLGRRAHDHNSNNGTFVNGKKVARAAVGSFAESRAGLFRRTETPQEQWLVQRDARRVADRSAVAPSALVPRRELHTISHGWNLR